MPWAKYCRKRLLSPLASHEGMSLAELEKDIQEHYYRVCRLKSIIKIKNRETAVVIRGGDSTEAKPLKYKM